MNISAEVPGPSSGTDSAPWRLGRHRYDDPVVIELVRQLQAIFVQRYGGPDAAVVDPDDFAPPRGHFIVGYWGDEPVACGGWRRWASSGTVAGATRDESEPVRAEIKRMYVLEGWQRRGFARRILGELEDSAARAGVDELILNTGSEQPEAIALYESSGYHRIPGFGHYAETPGAYFYGKSLSH